MSKDEPTDLLCRARRERLPEEARERLGRLVSQSAEARFLSAAFTTFEAESAARARDDALIARAVERTIAAADQGPPAARRRAPLPRHQRAFRIGLAAILVGSIAGASSGLVRRWMAGLGSKPDAFVVAPSRACGTCGAAEPSTREGTQRRGMARAAQDLAAGNTAALPSIGPAPGDGPPPSPPAALPAANKVVEAPAARGTSSADLFARANLARREGRAAEAMGLYRQIVSQHARTREAPLAQLTLAKLLTGSSPAEALHHFQALARSQGTFRAEALWGTAECARRLGQTSVELQALRALVQDYPASPYAEVAQSRLPGAP